MVYYCSVCKTSISDKEYQFSKSKFDQSLCREHQKSSNSKEDNAFDYNMIKGRIAEALIEQLFIKLGYGVYRYGMENTIPGIMELLTKVRSDVSNIIRRMPDFVIQDKQGEAYFVEVKFSKNEEFSISNLNEKKYGVYPFENAFFIVVSKEHIKCLSYKNLKAGKKITSKCHNYLGNIKEFETDKTTIKQFCVYAIKFFKEV